MNCLRNLVLSLCPALLLVAGQGRAATVIWSDTFETNVPSRWTTSTVWKIGAPTAGPNANPAGFRTHSGTNCAFTQGYPYNGDLRIACVKYNGTNILAVPAAEQSPRLRFWQWFKFANALGYVEISTNRGKDWIQVSTSLLNKNGGGVWTRAAVDLSPYAEQNIQVAFHFTSGGCCGNGLGWFVDDVEVDTSEAVLTFPESFEYDPKKSDWSVDFGTWEIGKPTSGPGTAHSGTNCAATILAAAYANNVDSRLLSAPFKVPASNAAMRYWQWYSFNNALGYVEINNGTISTTTSTNITIVTNTTSILDTNIYQLFGASNAAYATPFYWNPKIRGWTNGAKVFGVVQDIISGFYYFEAGTAPLATVGFGKNADYRLDPPLPIPRNANATNFISWHGTNWLSRTNQNDFPIGYFYTNSTTTYTTNTSVIVSQSNWKQVSAMYQNAASGGWGSVLLDLSAYSGQTVQLGFHFIAGGVYLAAGWYVDDLSLIAAPTLSVSNFTINFGQRFTNSISATNTVQPNSLFTFALAAASTNATIKTNGIVIWTNTNAPPGTYIVAAKVTDNNTPPYSVTNSFSVTVLPLQSQLVLSNVMFVVATNGDRNFKFSVKTPLTNSTWWILAATNLDTSTNWLPIYTNKTGPGGSLLFTDRLSTNFLQRYYRAVFP